jgi:hypothetical protein
MFSDLEMAKRGHVMPSIDMVGQRCGRLVVRARAGNAANGSASWRCVCDCGSERVVPGTKLREAAKKDQPLGCRDCSGRGGHQKLAGLVDPDDTIRCGRCAEPTLAEDFVTVPASVNARARGCLTRKICKSCSLTYDPNRVICKTCGSLTHRVVGPSCRDCQLVAGEDEPVVLNTTGIGNWSHVKSGRGTEPIPKRQSRDIISG